MYKQSHASAKMESVAVQQNYSIQIGLSPLLHPHRENTKIVFQYTSIPRIQMSYLPVIALNE